MVFQSLLIPLIYLGKPHVVGSNPSACNQQAPAICSNSSIRQAQVSRQSSFIEAAQTPHMQLHPCISHVQNGTSRVIQTSNLVFLKIAKQGACVCMAMVPYAIDHNRHRHDGSYICNHIYMQVSRKPG